jgi:hypothetical protein
MFDVEQPSWRMFDVEQPSWRMFDVEQPSWRMFAKYVFQFLTEEISHDQIFMLY